MIYWIASQMAIEYYQIENYQMAKKFFDRVVVAYRKEGWYTRTYIYICL
jgi:hypothetical protein